MRPYLDTTDGKSAALPKVQNQGMDIAQTETGPEAQAQGGDDVTVCSEDFDYLRRLLREMHLHIAEMNGPSVGRRLTLEQNERLRFRILELLQDIETVTVPVPADDPDAPDHVPF